jgi:uncharacterized protein
MTKDEFIAAALRNPANKIITDELFRLALPDAWLVSGCLVQTVWNVLTGRAVDYGIATTTSSISTAIRRGRQRMT